MPDSQWHTWTLFGMVALAVAPLASCYPRARQQSHETTVPAVKVMRVPMSPVVAEFALLGKLEPWRETTLSFEVPGVIESLFVSEGDQVEDGQPLARLVQTDFHLEVAELEANRDVAQARLDLLLAGTHQDDIATARAEYERAQTEANYWYSERKRIEHLVVEKAAPQGDLDVAQREHDASRHQAIAAEARWKRAVAGPRQQEIHAARAELRRSQLLVLIAEQRLAKATLSAPFGGRVEKRFLDEGALVNVLPTGNIPVFHLVDLDKVDAVVAAPVTALHQLELAMKVQVTSTIQPDLAAEGAVVAIGAVAEPATGTYAVRVRMPNIQGRLRAGMVVRCRFLREVMRNAIQIPAEAVQHADGQSPFVYLLDKDSRVVSRHVALAEIRGGRIEITRGLSAGELLVIGGQHRVIPGDRVRQIPVAETAGRDAEAAR